MYLLIYLLLLKENLLQMFSWAQRFHCVKSQQPLQKLITRSIATTDVAFTAV